MTCAGIPSIPADQVFARMKQAAPDQRIPFNGSLEITYRCNLKCVHCYQGERRFDNQFAEMSTAQIKHIIDEIVDAGCLYLTITGGEPLVRPDLFEILRYTKRKGVLVTLFTNATRIDEEAILKLSDCVPNQTEITLYGLTQSTYERVTGIPGSHKRCMQGLELLQAHNIPFRLKTMVLQQNFHELGGMIAFAKKLGVRFRYDSLVHAELELEKNPHLTRVTPQQVIEADLLDTERWQRLKQVWPLERGQTFDQEMVYHCGAGINGFHINPAGRLSLCLMVQNPSYNLLTGSFREGWDSFLKAERFAKASEPDSCIACDLLALCGHCPGRASVEQDANGVPNPFYCQVAHLRDALLMS